MFGLFKKKNPEENVQAQALYNIIVAQARQPLFYAEMDVPDSVDGRFEMISAHGILVMLRLETLGMHDLSQAIFDEMFLDMDRSLREMGISDLRVPKHMKRMLNGFNGRAQSYRLALDEAANHNALQEVVIRNIYGTCDDKYADTAVSAMVTYLSAQWTHLQGVTSESFQNAQNIFINEEASL